MYPREMGVEAGAKGFISINKTFTGPIYRQGRDGVKGKYGRSGKTHFCVAPAAESDIRKRVYLQECGNPVKTTGWNGTFCMQIQKETDLYTILGFSQRGPYLISADGPEKKW